MHADEGGLLAAVQPKFIGRILPLRTEEAVLIAGARER
jgi:hypothetical protein